MRADETPSTPSLVTILFIVVAGCFACAASAYAEVFQFGSNPTQTAVSCPNLSFAELATPPSSGERVGVCIFGELYADSEYLLVIPTGAASNIWDVVVYLPDFPILTLERLRSLRGKYVRLQADIHYDKRCWEIEKLPDGMRPECSPVLRPISAIRGELSVIH